MGDLTAVSSVVHQEQFNILFVGDQHLLEAVGEQVAGLAVLLAADLGHLQSASESPSGEAVDTSELSVGGRLKN